MIFAREVSDSLTSLVKKLDAATAKNSDAKMGSFVVFCNDDEDLKDKLKDRFPAMTGDLLVLRANFVIKRNDFGIQPGQYEDKVSNDIELSLSIAGMAPKK